MARPPSTHPTDGELEILQVLWQTGPCSIGQISKTLRQRRPSPRLPWRPCSRSCWKRNSSSERQGKQSYLWSAKTTQQSAASGMVRKLVNLVFDGSAQRLVAHLVESGQLTDEEREAVRRMMTTDYK